MNTEKKEETNANKRARTKSKARKRYQPAERRKERTR